MSKNVTYVEGNSKKLRRILRSHKIDQLSTLKILSIDSCANLKIEQLLQKIKTISSSLVNLNALSNHFQINRKDLSGIVNVIRMKLLNTAANQIATLTGMRIE